MADAGPDPRWERIRTVFDLAVELPATAWPGIVAREVPDDEALQREILGLLAALDADELHLDHPRFDFGAADEGAERVGTLVNPYRLARLIGRGGMGTVYEGVRADGAFEQRVAVKFIRPLLAVGVMAQRFRRERQILAALEHRNIARLIDGGATEGGEPFLVMEYVDGLPITTYADVRHLTLHQRLRLFLQVCGAVEHAHGKFIVHRDLKPANMLVTPDGSVKLLDFGVAKLFGAQDGDDLATMTHARPFTPEYASPEELRDEPSSAASDVYSLGIVLYELLSGRRPFEVPSRSPLAVLRAAETEPPRPSAVATAAAAQSSGETSLLRFRHLLAGELDNVVCQAIHPDAAVRYRSVERLSADIRRYLEGLPVSAQPDSAGYRLRKFVRRHRAAVAAAAVVTVTVAIGVAMALLQVRHTAAERTWEMALNASENLDELGLMHLDRGDVPGAEIPLRRASALCHTYHPAPGMPLTCARSIYDFGITLLWKGDLVGAEQALREVLGLVQAATGPLQAATAKALAGLARVRDARGDLTGAEQMFRQAAALFHAADADRSPDRVETLGWHAIALERQARFSEADSLVRLQLALANNADAPIVWLHLGAIHRAEGKLALARTEIARGRVSRGAEVDTAGLYYVIITLLESQFDLAEGRVEPAVAQLRRTLAIATRDYSPADPRLAEVQDALGLALMASHRAREALRFFTASNAILRRGFGPGHPETVASGLHLDAAREATGSRGAD